MIIPFHILSIYFRFIIHKLSCHLCLTARATGLLLRWNISNQIKVSVHLHVFLLSLTLFCTCMYVGACHQDVYLGEDNLTSAVHGGEWSALCSNHFVPYLRFPSIHLIDSSQGLPQSLSGSSCWAISPFLCWELKPSHWVFSHSLYLLGYHGSCFLHVCILQNLLPVMTKYALLFQLQPNSAAGSGALEHDPCCLYRPVPPVSTTSLILLQGFIHIN